MGHENSMKIKNISIGLPKKMKYGEGKEVISGIRKETVAEAFFNKRRLSRRWGC